MAAYSKARGTAAPTTIKAWLIFCVRLPRKAHEKNSGSLNIRRDHRASSLVSELFLLEVDVGELLLGISLGCRALFCDENGLEKSSFNQLE